MKITGMSVQMGAMPEQVCDFELMVYLDDTALYVANTKKRVPQYALGQIIPGQSILAVRVDPNDHAKVGIDFSVDPPEVRIAAGTAKATAASILATGNPCQAVIIMSEPLGMKSPSNFDIYAFVLTIMAEGSPPYQIKVGNPVPPEALPLLYPGSKVPAKFDATRAQRSGRH